MTSTKISMLIIHQFIFYRHCTNSYCIFQNHLEDSKIGKQLLDQAEAASNIILPNIAPLGKTKCQRELKNLKQDYEDYDNQLSGVNSKLQKCIVQWDQFETDVQAFDSQLKGIESALREDIQSKANLQEKKQLLNSYQVGVWYKMHFFVSFIYPVTLCSHWGTKDDLQLDYFLMHLISKQDFIVLLYRL